MYEHNNHNSLRDVLPRLLTEIGPGGRRVRCGVPSRGTEGPFVYHRQN
jgi:hypothetical protein